MTDENPIDDVLDLYSDSKRKALELFAIDPEWFQFPLTDMREHWWCIIGDELVSQYRGHAFSEEIAKQGRYRVHRIYSDPPLVVRRNETHVLVLVRYDFGNEIFVFDLRSELSAEQIAILEVNS
jgi:hypothetical protein